MKVLHNIVPLSIYLKASKLKGFVFKRGSTKPIVLRNKNISPKNDIFCSNNFSHDALPDDGKKIRVIFQITGGPQNFESVNPVSCLDATFDPILAKPISILHAKTRRGIFEI